jgi:iron complex outermembrane receptor protein
MTWRLPALMAAVVCLSAVPSVASAQALQMAAMRDLADLSLEELRDVIVTSASRRDQPLFGAAASIYVIAGDEIRRSGATTLPEALRHAPNLQVAAIDARQYAISARGFNGNVANKLLVMIDGRTIYSPLFSGVFWDAQDFVPADIDRIEVVSGPAGATWGTNAVNGVINVVTLPAARTLGPSVSTTLGTLDRTAIGRYGAQISEDLAIRAHVRTFGRDASQLLRGGDAGDASSGRSAGLRADWNRGDDAVTLLASAYRGDTDERPVFGAVDLSGSSVTARWSRRLGETSNFDVQAYFDSTRRTDRFLLQEDARIFDLEGKYRQTVGDHRWLAGIGYRRADDRSEPGLIFAFFPAAQRQDWYSMFARDEIAVTARLALTLGLRLERNPYTGWESLPSVRASYTISGNAFAWAALSRAVRSPARFDREIFAPPQPPFVISGGPAFVSEVANVAELGYRFQFGRDAALSATAFVHDYDRLRSGEVVGSTLVIENRIAGQVRGLEAWGNWRPDPHWRLDAGLLWLDEALRLKPGSTDPVGPSNLGNDAKLQWSLRSTHSLGEHIDLTLAVRHVNRLPSPAIPSYSATDLTLNWRVRPELQVSLGVRDAFDRRHAEYQGFSSVSEIPRSAFVALTWQPR